MRTRTLAVGSSVILLFTALAGAGELTLEGLLVPREELPEGYQEASGLHCVSVQPRTFYEMPAMRDFLPTPKRKATVSFAAPRRDPGTVLIFEYEKAFPRQFLESFLEGFLYGEPGGRSRLHPEEIILFDRFLLILSFPMGDPAAEWYKARLRTVHRIPATRHRPDLAPLIRKVMAAYDAGDAETGLKLLDANFQLLANVSFACYLRGEFGVMKGDFRTAEAGYRKAMELHDSLEDPISTDPGPVWACLDGLGISLIAQRKPADCVEVLTRAAAVGAELELGQIAQTHYNLACAYSLLKKFDEAYRHLAKAIEGKPAYKESAPRDSDLAEALRREEFRALLR
jgi:tetratricopeptide (TPR) repeat protein